MLISITEKCRMNCPHCMDDAREDSDKFMTFDMFKKAIDFNLKYDPVSILITGGEPTEHPEFWKFMDYVANKTAHKNIATTVTTNGMNLDKDKGELLERINIICKHNNIYFQVTSVKGLYPYQIDLSNPIFKHNAVTICDTIEAFYPMGRAKGKDYDFSKSRASKCFNLRSVTRQKGFRGAIITLRMMFKFCTPGIGYDGSIKVGESTLCPPVSHIDKPLDEIEKDIINFRCSGCKEINDKLPDIYKQAIGEL